jgi:hypothetical protein
MAASPNLFCQNFWLSLTLRQINLDFLVGFVECLHLQVRLWRCSRRDAVCVPVPIGHFDGFRLGIAFDLQHL